MWSGRQKDTHSKALRINLGPHWHGTFAEIGACVAGETFLSYSVPLPAENGSPIALLQRSLDKELAPYLRLEHTYLSLALLGLAVSAAMGTWIARGVSRPVLQVAKGASEIAAGNYQHRVELKQRDELGSLAASFNQMSEGLAERDRHWLWPRSDIARGGSVKLP